MLFRSSGRSRSRGPSQQAQPLTPTHILEQPRIVNCVPTHCAHMHCVLCSFGARPLIMSVCDTYIHTLLLFQRHLQLRAQHQGQRRGQSRRPRQLHLQRQKRSRWSRLLRKKMWRLARPGSFANGASMMARSADKNASPRLVEKLNGAAGHPHQTTPSSSIRNT